MLLQGYECLGKVELSFEAIECRVVDTVLVRNASLIRFRLRNRIRIQGLALILDPNQSDLGSSNVTRLARID
jgi:hypothetical protein